LESNGRNVLLVSPYKTKYPILGLMKISTYHKNKGDNVTSSIGFEFQEEDPDFIYISSLFTYKAGKTLDVILRYKQWYPDAEIKVGGIYATLMPEHVEKNTGIRPKIGLWDEIDNLPPDYTLFNIDNKFNDYSFVFTSRSCRNNCSFCAVKTLEPEYRENDRWVDSINMDRSKIMIHDNNFTTVRFDHFKNVTLKLAEIDKRVIFDNGFDCRFLKQKHMDYLKNLDFLRCGFRMAFDNMSQDGYIQDAIKLVKDKNGLPKSKLFVFVLFNFEDNLDEALYRAREVRRLGVRVYPQRYVPLDWTDKQSNYVGPEWEKEMVREFRFYWMMPGIHKKMSWDEYMSRGGHKGVFAS